MIIAPNTTNGERSSRRSVRFTPFCIWFISLVILVMRVEVPTWSISDHDRLSMWRNNSCFTLEENPTAALAAKYCAVMENEKLQESFKQLEQRPEYAFLFVFFNVNK